MSDSQGPAQAGETTPKQENLPKQEAAKDYPAPEFAADIADINEAEEAAKEKKNAKEQATEKPAKKRPQKKQSANSKPAGKTKTDDGASDPLGVVVTRNSFYRDGYRLWITVAALEGFALLCMGIAMIVLISVHQPENKYFATTEDGRVVPMVPLGQPNLSKPALMSWAAQSATEVMTFNFADYRRRLQEASRHFTREGWKSFTQALQSADIIKAVNENRQVVSAAPRQAPVLLSEGVIAGRYQWVIEIPMMFTYQFGQSKRSESMNVRLTIVRVPKLESPNGVGIQQWIAYRGG